MDITETYIKMRTKAIPDLGMGTPPKVIPYCFITDTVFADSIGNFYCMYQQGKDDAVIGCQLERQDQLQEMLEHWKGSVPNFNLAFLTIVNGAINKDSASVDYYWQFTSMEQLWLAFVMKEKYNKVWKSDEWIPG